MSEGNFASTLLGSRVRFRLLKMGEQIISREPFFFIYSKYEYDYYILLSKVLGHLGYDFNRRRVYEVIWRCTPVQEHVTNLVNLHDLEETIITFLNAHGRRILTENLVDPIERMTATIINIVDYMNIDPLGQYCKVPSVREWPILNELVKVLSTKGFIVVPPNPRDGHLRITKGGRSSPFLQCNHDGIRNYVVNWYDNLQEVEEVFDDAKPFKVLKAIDNATIGVLGGYVTVNFNRESLDQHDSNKLIFVMRSLGVKPKVGGYLFENLADVETCIATAAQCGFSEVYREAVMKLLSRVERAVRDIKEINETSQVNRDIMISTKPFPIEKLRTVYHTTMLNKDAIVVEEYIQEINDRLLGLANKGESMVTTMDDVESHLASIICIAFNKSGYVADSICDDSGMCKVTVTASANPE